MLIFDIKIQNFRGIKNAHVNELDNVSCLLGAGDTGKTTFLDAIEYTLSPNWNLPINDSDFYDGCIDNSIVIEVTVGSVPDELKSELKYGLFLKGWDYENSILNTEPKDNDILVLTVQLVIDSSLTPEWKVVNDNNPEGKKISYRDRQKFSVVRIKENSTAHLTWRRGSALFSLTDNVNDANEVITEANRTLRDNDIFKNIDTFDDVSTKAQEVAKEYGVGEITIQPAIDPSMTNSSLGVLSLHDDRLIPLRGYGRGSTRLMAIGLQVECVMHGAILLIDEIEHALEPYRIIHLINKIINVCSGDGCGQVIFTSHSQTTSCELSIENIYFATNNNSEFRLIKGHEDYQGVIRKNPVAFLSHRVLVCEGKTEYGIIRKIQEHWGENKDESETYLATKQIVSVNGSGSDAISLIKYLQLIGKDICYFGDNDKPEDIEQIEGLNVPAVVCEEGNSIEQQIAKDLPLEAIVELCVEIIDRNSIEHFLDKINAFDSSFTYTNNWQAEVIDSEDSFRVIFGKVAKDQKNNKKPWLKSIYAGKKIGTLLIKHYSEIEDTKINSNLNDIKKWIQNG